MRVGLTGGVASGKSAVAAVWAELGASIIDADELARDAVSPRSTALERIRERFGPGVIAPDGALDRSAMRAIVFEDATARRELEAILHPEIERLRRDRDARLVAGGARVIVHVIPLLFETGLDATVDLVVLVTAPDAVRLERLIALRGLDEATARGIMAAQMPQQEKRERADIVIANDTDLESLERRARAVWARIEGIVRATRIGGAG